MIYYVNSRENVDSEKSEPQMGKNPSPRWGSELSESTFLLEFT